ncbi:MAG TPA: hypothetical protein VNU96_01145 [Burkholderiales bacterium]|jgi:hypothetical protein|nr:hypothetical protein [Burkholderiales bacterium]
MKRIIFKHITFNRRTACLAGAAALVLAAAASMVAGRERHSPEVVQAAPRPAFEGAPRTARAVAAPTTGIDLAKLERSTLATPGNDPFAPKSFAPPPAATVAHASAAAAAAQPPSAPPLPFVYAGRVTQDGKTEVYVTRNDELIAVAAGEKIDGEYRVDAITAASIRFTYLPLKTVQSLELEAGG